MQTKLQYKDVSIRNKVVVPIVHPNTEANIDVEFVSFHHLSDEREHLALCFAGWDQQEVPLVRVHSECLTGDIFSSLRCDCGQQLNEAIVTLAEKGGILLYLRQEGRGIGLYNKLDAYTLQLKGKDTYQANSDLNFAEDARDYRVAYDMLQALGIKKIKLLSNNPDKYRQLASYGIDIAEQVNTRTYSNPFNYYYLMTKAAKTKHQLNFLTNGEHRDSAHCAH